MREESLAMREALRILRATKDEAESDLCIRSRNKKPEV